MNTNVYLEIFGYIGTALIILSMMMKSIVKLRVLNISGAIISAIYAIICRTWPVVFLNIALSTINLVHLFMDSIHKRNGNAVNAAENSTLDSATDKNTVTQGDQI